MSPGQWESWSPQRGSDNQELHPQKHSHHQQSGWEEGSLWTSWLNPSEIEKTRKNGWWIQWWCISQAEPERQEQSWGRTLREQFSNHLFLLPYLSCHIVSLSHYFPPTSIQPLEDLAKLLGSFSVSKVWSLVHNFWILNSSAPMIP